MSEFGQEYEISRSAISDLEEVAALSEGLHGGLDYLDYVFPHWVRAEEKEMQEREASEGAGGAEEEGGGRWRNLTLRVSGSGSCTASHLH